MARVNHLVNLTPHTVAVVSSANKVLLSIPPSGVFARLIEVRGSIQQLPFNNTQLPTRSICYEDRIDGLPAPELGTAYIVSRITAQAAKRADLYFPADEVRDSNGQIIGCTVLGQFLQGES